MEIEHSGIDVTEEPGQEALANKDEFNQGKKLKRSRQVVTSVMEQVETMKVPQKKEQFCNLNDHLQKIERDMEEVDMVTSLKQESVILNFENMLSKIFSSLEIFGPLTNHVSNVRKGTTVRNKVCPEDY